MRVAHIEPIGGAAGNMLMGAFVDAGADIELLQAALRSVVPRGWRLARGKVVKRGIAATHIDFSIDEEGGERHLSDVLRIIDASGLTDEQRRRAKGVYLRLAQAEAKVRGSTVEAIHFHEAGALDAILGVAGTCIAIDLLEVERLTCGAIPIGRGTVQMQQGQYPNPPPSTAELLLGLPVYDAEIDGELITSTGAALLTTLCETFGGRPAMRAESIGYGAGTRDLAIPNVTRLTIGEAVALPIRAPNEVCVIEANIDDMSPQFYELAVERVFASGAYEVWLTPIAMKRGRPALQISATAPLEREYAVAHAMLSETTTTGVRVRTERRYEMERQIHTIATPLGEVRVKAVHFNGIRRVIPEYEDVVRIARERHEPLPQVLAAVQHYIDESNVP